MGQGHLDMAWMQCGDGRSVVRNNQVAVHFWPDLAKLVILEIPAGPRMTVSEKVTPFGVMGPFQLSVPKISFAECVW